MRTKCELQSENISRKHIGSSRKYPKKAIAIFP
jgi:hypothetical protein